MPTVLAFSSGGGGMALIVSATMPTDLQYLDGRTVWLNSTNNKIYFYTDNAWRALNTYQ